VVSIPTTTAPITPKLLAAAALLTLSTGVAAQGADARRAQAERDAGVCAEGTGVPELDIVVCTRAIRLGGHSPLTLSTLHNARGQAYRITGRLQRSREEHTRALSANPLSAAAHHGRALAVLAMDEREGVAPDLERALALFPNFAQAWRTLGRFRFIGGDDAGAATALERALAIDDSDGEAHAFRGFVRYRQGRFGEAAGDFREARERQLGYAYAVLWEYLARRRAGEPSGSVLEDAAAALGEDEWPSALVGAYLGLRDEESVRAQPGLVPGPRSVARDYEAAFYLGQLALARGRPAAARAYFDVVRERARRNSVERAMLPP
jgi:tetratricopeptide (TPR) repeat protein